MEEAFLPDEGFARELDARDGLARFREAFLIPRRPDGSPAVYLCGHSLGLQPRAAREFVLSELDAWAELGVEGHFKSGSPWYSYHELVREPLARLVGARPDEVVAMNSLTVNLHLLMATFYRPTRDRYAILMDAPAFPSDLYAAQSQLRHHGFDPADGLMVVSPGRLGDVLEHEGERVAVVLCNGVNFLTGEWYDLPRLTAAARRRGCTVGLDLAHAAGNVPLSLHDWGVDFAVWCSYKYLNSGPGAVAGCFVHERHARDSALPRFAGWWGHRQDTRFRMGPEFEATAGADGWQLSNPPILALAPLRVSLEIFHRASIARLREKSIALTGWLAALIEREAGHVLDIVTPSDPAQRGCQLSLRVKGPRDAGRSLFEHLNANGVVGDWREPDVIRVAPTPLYNRHADCLRFVRSVVAWSKRS
jgi:kynureninase